MTSKTPRIIVIGAGVGGLTTAALLAHDGYDVTVFEAQTYPGGSASTFTHKGYQFESGATVAGGFQPDGPHAILGDLLSIDWPVHLHDPAWVVHLPDRSIAFTQDYSDVLHHFPNTVGFWRQQRRIADLAWSMAAAGLPWPPRDVHELAQLARVGLKHLPGALEIAPLALTNVHNWLRWHGQHKDAAFVRFLDATLLISAQTTTPHVNALYGATAIDLPRQGVYHVEGGIGGIAETLVEKLDELGAKIYYRMFVTRIAVENGRVTGVYTKKGRRSQQETFYPADFVIANATPWSLESLLAEDTPRSLKQEVSRREATQGAFVLHLGIHADRIPPHIPDHHQIVRQMHGPMGEGQTLFVSMSPSWDTGRAPAGMRAVTVSTHTRVDRWWQLLGEDDVRYQQAKYELADEIIQAIDTAIPGFASSVELMLPGTPVTYEFYTLRQQGMVGGFPQTSLFRARGPRTGLPNLRLVGDSIFPGQSTAGVTLGALRVASDAKRHLPRPHASARRSPRHTTIEKETVP